MIGLGVDLRCERLEGEDVFSVVNITHGDGALVALPRAASRELMTLDQVS